MRKTILLAAIALAIAGCSPSNYLFGQALVDDEIRAKAFTNKCEEFGFEQGTPEFEDCMKHEEMLWQLPY